MSRFEKAGAIIVMGCGFVALGILIASAGILLGMFIAQPIHHSAEQPIDSINEQYQECKKNAPQGFDCAITYLMVSDGYMQEMKAWYGE